MSQSRSHISDSSSVPDPRGGQVARADLAAVPVVAVSGEFDLDSCPLLLEAVTTAAGEGRVVVLDLTEVAFADSTFLNVLLRAHQLTDLRLAGVSEQVERLLEITGTDQLLKLFPTVADAAAAPDTPV
ncbi:STAS domain-containing protein (plasmid) [Streptomyces sp. CA-294286]|uniref:STAS domain-containing protein n=1 Tax=Streptomyces sp. CA-294286 TaxID=3240070 RepID=UPI003D93DAB4